MEDTLSETPHDRRVMLFNTQSTGHHAEHVQHIVKHSATIRPNVQLIATVPSSTIEAVQDNIEDPNAQFVALDSEEIKRVHSQKSQWRRSLAEWKLAERHARRLDVDHCVLLDLNWFQFALGLPSANSVPFTLSGIYFFPFVRLSPLDHSGSDRIRQVTRYVRKWAVAWWMMRNPKLKTVFVLNDPTAAEQLNNQVDSSRCRFRSLPDPVFSLAENDGTASIYDKHSLDESRYTFLFAGTISRRKGVLKTLDAFRCLGADEQGRCALVLAGRLVDDVADEVTNRVEHLREHTELEVRTDFRFLSEAEFHQALSDCDVILTPYQRTEGSSGMLGHAAQVQRPVIGPRRGLIGELISRYELGMTVNASREKEIAHAIQSSLEEGICLEEESKKYIRDNTPDDFAEQIMKEID
jgi:glycosyltransferase involved in cell wall biosynthesis